MKKIIALILVLATMSVFLAACGQEKTAVDVPQTSIPTTETVISNETTNLLDMLSFNLPADVTRRRDSGTKETFVKNTSEVGGVFLLDCDSKIFDDVLNTHDNVTTLVLNAMKDLGIQWEWHMSESSVHGLLEVNMGEGSAEYMAYAVRGYSACYVIWFDRTQIANSDEIAIMESLSSDDITDELNMISSQAYADAIAESMANEEYQFEVVLPEGIVLGDQTEDGALFYQNGQLVGGYKTIYFEKGILPAVHENQELIIERMKEYLADQIDLAAFTGEIIDEGLITVRFSNGTTEYTHYIMTYGQVGIQYDIWFDENILNKNTVNNIIWGAKLIKQ